MEMLHNGDSVSEEEVKDLMKYSLWYLDKMEEHQHMTEWRVATWYSKKVIFQQENADL